MAKPDASKASASDTRKFKFKERWGKTIAKRGFTAVPNILLEKQHALGLKPTELNVLLVLLKHWWSHDELPYPAKETIAGCIGVSPRTVQRSIATMKGLGLIEAQQLPGGHLPNQYSFNGLIKILGPHAKEAHEQQQKHREEKKERQRRKRARVEEEE